MTRQHQEAARTPASPAPPDFEVVGKDVEKVDGIALATGRALYAGDFQMRGMLVGKILPSPHAHARIRNIDVSAARAVPGVHAVLTWKDLPRNPHTTAGQGYPEPSPYDSFVLDNKVRFVGDRVAAVAAETHEAADEALRRIQVDYEVLEPVLDPRKATEPGAPVIHDEPEAHVIIPVRYEPERNLAAHVGAEVGDPDAAFAAQDAVVVENEFETQYAQHCPIEPHVVLSYLDDRDRLIIITSTQVPFHVRRIVAQALDLPVRRIRVIKPRIGGGFGAKQEVLLEQLCAALALAARRPVRMIYTRREEFVAARTRHPQIVRLKAAVGPDGTPRAIDLNVLMNTGAYGSHALTVASNTGSKTLPLYNWTDLRFEANVVYTNLPVGGAYRGYGVTQGAFALECTIDEICERIGADPVAWRKAHHIQRGGTSPIFEKLGEGKPGVPFTIGSCELDRCLEVGAQAIGWEEKRARPAGDGPIRRGVGMAALMQGSSIPHIDMGAATIKMNEDGSFNLLVGATDLGTGSDTVLAQVAAETLGVPVEQIIVLSSDTDVTPFDVGAYASSTTYLSGEAVRRAAVQVADRILEFAARMLDRSRDTLVLKDEKVVAQDGKSVSLQEIGTESLYVSEQEQICATASCVTEKSPPPFAAHFAEVEVDMETGFVRVLKYVAAVDCGTALHPKLAEGQVEGAVLNGLSYALTEEYLFNEQGRMLNDSFRHYKIFSTRDRIDIQTILVPSYEPTGPYGAKSVSEININGPLPAISNAIYHAVGVRMRKAPFTPERVLEAIAARKKA